MSKNSEAISVILEETHKDTLAVVESASFDRTERGTIIEVLGNNKYLIRIKGTVYTVPSPLPLDLSVNDTVFVLFPNNNAREKHITGKCGDTKVNADIFVASSLAPANTKLLWIDTNATTGGLKYYNGTTWVAVPIRNG